jgi:hypothetical protein
MVRLYIYQSFDFRQEKMSTPVRSFVRSYNRYNILNAIRTAGMISRIDISRDLGLSKASLTGITAPCVNVSA